MSIASLCGLRVLVVEDGFYMADDLARELERAGAVTVGPASSIEQAEEAIASQQIDAAVLDLNLHGKRTDQLAERLTNEGVPCLIVSGYGKESVAPALQNAPRLEKPVDSRTIVRALVQQLQ